MAATKPVKLELNNSGAWKRLGGFDAADDDQAALVMDAAEELVKTLHNSEDPKRCPTMRICVDEALGAVLMRWELFEEEEMEPLQEQARIEPLAEEDASTSDHPAQLVLFA